MAHTRELCRCASIHLETAQIETANRKYTSVSKALPIISKNFFMLAWGGISKKAKRHIEHIHAGQTHILIQKKLFMMRLRQ